MKTSFNWNWKTALVLAGLPFIVVGLHVLPTKAQDANTSGAVASANTDTPAANTPLASPAGAGAATQPSAATTPPDLQLYGGTKEVVKLAQAGVDDGVILSYITNANVRFGVNPDQIIYLNDLGVSGAVVTAMMQHDAALNAAAATTPPSPSTGAPPAGPGADYPSPSAQSQDDPSAATPPPDTTDYADYAGPNPGDNPVADDTDYFYDSLQPYGNWIYLTGYGMCWQPTVYLRDRAWRPYFDRGRWIYTDCGWYWQSDYSWGWAAFHYGRWFCDTRRGWVWRPNRVWGPAWVAWRESGGYAGWAPLPPAAVFIPGAGFRFHNQVVTASFGFGLPAGLFAFIPIERLADYAPSRYVVAAWQAPGIFSESRALTGVTVQNQAVANIGLDPQQVDAAAGVRVRRAVIQQVPGTDANGRVQPDRLGRRGGALVIYRPQLPAVPSRHAAGPSAGRMAAPGVAGATRSSLNASPATSAGDLQPVSRVHVYYVTHQDPEPAATASSSSLTATASRYAPNSMVLVGPRNLTQPQWEQIPGQVPSSEMQLRYNRPGYTPNSAWSQSAPGQGRLLRASSYVVGSGSSDGNQQRYGTSTASYESSYRPSQGVAAAPSQGSTYDAPRNDYRQPAYSSPSRPEPSYREPAPEPQTRENYSAPARQQSYSSHNVTYSQPSSSSSSSGSGQRK